MASIHEEEVLGKAYDSRLMKRLLGYLRPYRLQVTVALAAIILKAGVDVLGPYLTKVAIDKYLAQRTYTHSWLDRYLSSQPMTGTPGLPAAVSCGWWSAGSNRRRGCGRVRLRCRRS